GTTWPVTVRQPRDRSAVARPAARFSRRPEPVSDPGADVDRHDAPWGLVRCGWHLLRVSSLPARPSRYAAATSIDQLRRRCPRQTGVAPPLGRRAPLRGSRTTVTSSEQSVVPAWQTT